MFTITPTLEYVLSVLDATKVMRKEQAFKLLKKFDAGKTEEHLIRDLRQLKHIQKIVWKSDDVLTTPLLFNEPTDEEMLSAIDIMLDLTDRRILSISRGPAPYTLRFVSEYRDRVKAFAVIIVNARSERSIKALLPGGSDECTIIFVISSLSQKDRIKTSLQHFFAVRDGGRYRYYRKG
jgi:hypothetical protein